MTNNYFAEGLKNLQGIDWQMPFCFLSKTNEELSLIYPEANLPTQTLPCEYGGAPLGSAARWILPLLVSLPIFLDYWLLRVSASLLFPHIIPTIS